MATAEEKGDNSVGLKYVHENRNLMCKAKGRGMSG